MIKDYELIRNEEFIHKKRFIIWGTGKGGRELLTKLQVETDQIEFVDSDKSKAGECQGKYVYGPERLSEYQEQDDVAIVISALSVELQNEMAAQIERMGNTHDIYTKFAVEIALRMLERKRIVARDNDREIQFLHDQVNVQRAAMNNMIRRLRMMEQFFSAGMAEQTVFVYQSKKVGSSTICESLLDIGVYAFHVHRFEDSSSFLSTETIKQFIKRKQGKVISLVRDPVARQLSLMWRGMDRNAQALIAQYGSFDNIEKAFLSIPNRDDEFEWYIKEMETVLGVNVYDYPFDREQGYAVIEDDGISILMIKLEKIALLKNVIEEFLQVDSFKLLNCNEAKEKAYRYAYKDYLNQVEIPKEFMEYYYQKNKYMRHFYTEKEIQQFYERWNHLN